MDMKVSVVLALIVAGFFPLTSLVLWQLSPGAFYTEETAVEVALSYMRGAPTFRFDGIPASVQVVKVETVRSPWTWKVSIAFECHHAGYGDRTGMVLAQVITPHLMRVTVEKGVVVEAVIDGAWDELAQRSLG